MPSEPSYHYVSSRKDTNNQKDQPSRDKVLVIDDNAELRKGLSLALTRASFDVTLVENGNAAIETTDQEKFALLLDTFNCYLSVIFRLYNYSNKNSARAGRTCGIFS